MIGETFASLLTVSVQPLVAGFPTDAITLAQLRKAHRFFLRQSHKLLAQRHETNHSPRHKLSPLSISGRTMPLVTEKVLPMSLVHLLPMSPVYTGREERGHAIEMNSVSSNESTVRNLRKLQKKVSIMVIQVVGRYSEMPTIDSDSHV